MFQMATDYVRASVFDRMSSRKMFFFDSFGRRGGAWGHPSALRCGSTACGKSAACGRVVFCSFRWVGGLICGLWYRFFLCKHINSPFAKPCRTRKTSSQHSSSRSWICDSRDKRILALNYLFWDCIRKLYALVPFERRLKRTNTTILYHNLIFLSIFFCRLPKVTYVRVTC